jgi:hypothetical protein
VDSPKLSLSHTSPMSVHTRTAWHNGSEAYESFFPPGGAKRKRV